MPSKSISPVLYRALEAMLERKEQAFLMYNRRGFASYFQCEKCNSVLECSNCSVTMTYHQIQNSVLCHYCGLSLLPPQFCAKCRSDETQQEPGKYVHRGAGTEKLYDEVLSLFPYAKVSRLDRDVANNIEKYREVLAAVRSGETSILVGTQMIAKGHDLPGVTLVGIVDCDVGLHMPDFRAGERIFQLLTQAAGRAGRGDKPGKVILQTRVPKSLSLRKTIDQDFNGFAGVELKSRHELGFPPFSRLLRIVFSSADKDQAAEIASLFKQTADKFISQTNLPVDLKGPSPAPLQKLKTLWRWHLLLRSQRVTDLNKVMQFLKKQKWNSKTIRIIFDMDPQDMM